MACQPLIRQGLAYGMLLHYMMTSPQRLYCGSQPHCRSLHARAVHAVAPMRWLCGGDLRRWLRRAGMRIRRVWLRGPNAGTVDVLLDNLPGCAGPP